ncbi:MAG TPA: hypothetical protein VMM13_11740, partial [Euzebya sp.]|nr:hypothetical protein [Euzebya sp.]
MAASFPTALQRTSDERWVTLDVVAREPDRALARIIEAPSQAAVVRLHHGQAYDRHLRALLSTPPPDPGVGVHLSWPVDLLHDLDARAIGYAAPRPQGPHTYALADFVDPTRRAQIAPMATRRHLLRVARNVATATAALHHAGHARIRGRNFRLDDRARVVVVRTDELISDASPTQKADDQRRLAYLVVRLLGGRPWASEGELAALMRRAGDPTLPTAPAEEWFFALRQAERSLPKAPTVTIAPAAPERVILGTDLATALRQARRESTSAAPTASRSAAPPPPQPSRGLSPLSAQGGQARQASAGRPPLAGPVPTADAPAPSTPVDGRQSRLVRISSAPLRETSTTARAAASSTGAAPPTRGTSSLAARGGQTRQASEGERSVGEGTAGASSRPARGGA